VCAPAAGKRSRNGQLRDGRRIKFDLANLRWGFRYGRNLQIRITITVKPEVRNNAMTSVLVVPHFSWRLSSQILFETHKENSMVKSLKIRLKCWIWNGAKAMTLRRSATGSTLVHFTEEMRSPKMVQYG